MPALPLAAKHSFIYIAETEQFLMLKGDADERIYPASLTKLFTTYVALQYLDPDMKVTMGDEVYAVEADSSKAGLGPGITLTVRQLVQAMLLNSGSDASVALATAAGRKLENNENLPYKKAINRFVEEMNTVAVQLGLNGSHFVTVDGYHHENHYTTPRDMQKVGALALSQPALREVMGMRQATPSVKLPYLNTPWRNTNFLLQPNSKYYIPTAFGMKTGHTSVSGGCLLASFHVEGEKTLIVGIFGCAKREDRFVDAQKIYNAYVQNAG
jgi:D-alanyl-D-alanine carboxypeptidase (penicillin-binding protein 5/6)